MLVPWYHISQASIQQGCRMSHTRKAHPLGCSILRFYCSQRWCWRSMNARLSEGTWVRSRSLLDTLAMREELDQPLRACVWASIRLLRARAPCFGATIDCFIKPTRPWFPSPCQSQCLSLHLKQASAYSHKRGRSVSNPRHPLVGTQFDYGTLDTAHKERTCASVHARSSISKGSVSW